jgi:phospholipase/carboxylesterase
MHLIHTTLVHKVIEPQSKSSAKAPALILLHGRGANENDLLSFAEYLDERLFLISVRAPFPFQQGGGYTWFDILEMGKPEPKMFSESYTKVMQFIDDVKKGYPVNPSKIFLCGFSMGAIISFAVSLLQADIVAGVIANSGYIPEESELKYDWSNVRGKPFFISHGLFDPVIPVSFGRRASELLRGVHADVCYREYEMGHQIGEESLNDIMQWLTKHLDRTGPSHLPRME